LILYRLSGMMATMIEDVRSRVESLLRVKIALHPEKKHFTDVLGVKSRYALHGLPHLLKMVKDNGIEQR